MTDKREEYKRIDEERKKQIGENARKALDIINKYKKEKNKKTRDDGEER